jgi:hydrogenase-4 membrane subunit HyfE
MSRFKYLVLSTGLNILVIILIFAMYFLGFFRMIITRKPFEESWGYYNFKLAKYFKEKDDHSG